MILRDYQDQSVVDLFDWWTRHQGADDIPLLVLPTAAGKSVICAEIVRRMYEQWPDYKPRTVVLVPSKELAQQNAAKLIALLPVHITVGYVSASLGKKQFNADVIVATIGSIRNSAHLLGDIKCVIIDEAHLVSPKGTDSGMYRSFLSSLATICNFRTVGMTATPFRGNGIWLTDGDAPLFTGVASNVTMRQLLDQKFIAPLIPPTVEIATKIDASGVGMLSGDYKLNELSNVVSLYIKTAAAESVRIASDRAKWIAFTPSVANADSLAAELCALGIATAVVCGETDKDVRTQLIDDFRAGKLRCLVTVLALSVGFDVPDVDCILWLRPTQSPVLYVQGMGRGVRIFDGKSDCLVLDFTDTVERLGPVDAIRARAKKDSGDRGAPFKVCGECGARNLAAAWECAECGAMLREATPEVKAKASTFDLLSIPSKVSLPVWHDVTNVEYRKHTKEGKPDSMRVDYYDGIVRVASEWICFDHVGFARQKAFQWAATRDGKFGNYLTTTDSMIERASSGNFKEPTRIETIKNGKFSQITNYEFTRTNLPASNPSESLA